MTHFRLLVVFCGLAIAAGGCGDSGSSPPPGGDTGDAGTGDVSMDDTATGFDPWVAVPAEQLVRTASEVCPTGFQEVPMAAGQHGSYEAGGQTRSFHLALPDPSIYPGPRPMMVLFNGTGGTGAGFSESTGLDSLEDAGWVVLGPDSNANGTVWPVWDAMRMPDEEGMPNADMDLFDSLVDCVAAHVSVDANRLYVAGHSAGGIMSNRVLRHRSDLLAGGIVASGVFSLTSAQPPPVLDDMAVVVTWGGVNDAWGGAADDEETEVPEINFVEQSSLASQHYEEAPGVHQVACHGDDIGHEWLDGINDWMADYLLAHPKGLSIHGDWVFAEPDPTTSVTCSEEAYVWEPLVVVKCPASDTTGCYETCQFMADCTVENGTVSAPLAPQFEDLGFTGDSYENCDGCVSLCEQDAALGAAADVEVLTCIRDAFDAAVCGAGVEGALPYILAANACCADQLESHVCARLCTTVMTNSVVVPFFEDTCAHWAPPCPEGDEDCAGE